MNNNQQLKKYFRRQIENLIFLYTWSLLDWCHMQNKILSQYIARYWWESINMLKKLQEDITDDYNTNLYMLYKRLFDFENPTTYFLKNLVWKPSVWLIKKLRETNNTNKKLKSDDLCHYLKYFLQNWSDKWTTFFKDYKSLYHSVYSCFILYQKDKENFLQFLEHYLLTFITIQIIFDTLEQIKEKNNQEYLIKPRLFIEQTRKILWTIYLELEKRIWKEKLDYCYKRLKKMLKNSTIDFDYKMQYLSEYLLIWKDIKNDVQQFDTAKLNKFPIYVLSYEELQWLNKSLDYQKYVSDLITLFKKHEEDLWFSNVEKGDNYLFYKKLTHFSQIIWLDDMLTVRCNSLKELRFKNNNYENVKKEIDVYIENMLSLYEDWIKKSIWKYCDKQNFISNTKNWININFFGKQSLKIFKTLDRISYFKDYIYLNDFWKRYTLDTSRWFIDCDTWEIKKWKEEEFLDYIFENDVLIDCYTINCSIFDNYLTISSSILWQQYFFIKIFDYLLNEKNNNWYLYNILFCIMYKEEFDKMEEDELKTWFSLNFVKCNILNCLDTYYDNFLNKETKEEMIYTNNEIKKNYVTLSKQLVQLKKLLYKNI